MYEWNWPIFILIDELWKIINLRNGSVPVREGSYIFDIPFFNDFAIYVQGIQQELPNDNKLTVFDVLAMCEDSYLENNAIMNKALKIGLKELINKGEILKGG